MTTADNLNRIIQAKADIKQAIENKGVYVGDVTIDAYAEKINYIPSGTETKWIMPNGVKFSKTAVEHFDGGFIDTAYVIDFSSMFENSKFASVDLTYWAVDRANNMSRMFYSCYNLTSLDSLENWRTDVVQKMDNMFYDCESLTSLEPIKNWDVSFVNDMSYMFDSCESLTSLEPIKNWDVSFVNDMSYMFGGCSNLTSLEPIKNWNTSSVYSMGNMFRNCRNLTSVDLSNWDTSRVTDMGAMFFNCYGLTSLSSIDCSGVNRTYFPYPLYFSSNNSTALTDVGGFIGMKMSWTDYYGLVKCPNLTYQSCINILNGLYDFTGNGETPNSYQGELLVHSNFFDLVGDEIAIGTNKGWIIEKG